MLALAMMGSCIAHAPSSPDKARQAMILAVDFKLCAGNEMKTDIVWVNPSQDNKFCAFAAESDYWAEFGID